MNRFALIIDGSRVDPVYPIDGCARDADAWESWLTSPAGGGWKTGEYKVLNNPTKDQIDNYKSKLDKADFAISTFSGHGRILDHTTVTYNSLPLLALMAQLRFHFPIWSLRRQK